jgi:hypothetical protein
MVPEFGTRRVLMARRPICRRWKCYVNFRRDLGPRPSWQHLVIRDDLTGAFEPGNCSWQIGGRFRRRRSTTR